MDNVIVLRSLNEYLLKKTATMLKCTCKTAYLIISPKNYYPLMKQLNLKKNFSFIDCPKQKEAILHDYKVVIGLGFQNYFKYHDPRENFMYSTSHEINEIGKYCYRGHSGASFALCMRDLEFIFKNGYYAYFFRFKRN